MYPYLSHIEKFATDINIISTSALMTYLTNNMYRVENNIFYQNSDQLNINLNMPIIDTESEENTSINLRITTQSIFDKLIYFLNMINSTSADNNINKITGLALNIDIVLTDEMFTNLINNIKNLKSLRRISLYLPKYENTTKINELIQSLDELTKLRLLAFHNFLFTDECIESLTKLINNNMDTIILDSIDMTNLTILKVNNMIDALKSLDNLRILEIINCFIKVSDSILDNFTLLLESNKTLDKFIFTENELHESGNESLTHFISAIFKLPLLSEVNVSSLDHLQNPIEIPVMEIKFNNVTDKTLMIYKLLNQNNVTTKIITFYEMNFTKDNMKSLYDLLNYLANNNIENINIVKSDLGNITDTNIIHELHNVMGSISDQPSLKEVSLALNHLNKLSNNGLRDLFYNLVKSKTQVEILKVDISSNDLTQDQIDTLKQLLSCNYMDVVLINNAEEIKITHNPNQEICKTINTHNFNKSNTDTTGLALGITLAILFGLLAVFMLFKGLGLL